MNIVNENVYLEKVIIFLEEIGINVIEKQLDNATFLPGISLGPNCIYIDLKKILYAGDILHEAGHLQLLLLQKEKILIFQITIPARVMKLLQCYGRMQHYSI